MLLVYLVLTFAISGIVHYLIELKLQRLLRKLTLPQIMHSCKVLLRLAVLTATNYLASLSRPPKRLYREAVSLYLNGPIRYSKYPGSNPDGRPTRI